MSEIEFTSQEEKELLSSFRRSEDGSWSSRRSISMKGLRIGSISGLGPGGNIRWLTSDLLDRLEEKHRKR